jgi:hypothetical protein
VLRHAEGRGPAPFRVLLDGRAQCVVGGADIDGDGTGLLDDDRLHELVRQQGAVEERTFAIAFQKPGVEAYVFTFG